MTLHRCDEGMLTRIRRVADECAAPHTGTVYFIRNETTLAVKVGFTTGDPLTRLATFQTAHEHELRLFGWMPGSMELEAALHAEFSRSRIRGEWFRIRTPDWFVYDVRPVGFRWADLEEAVPRVLRALDKVEEVPDARLCINVQRGKPILYTWWDGICCRVSPNGGDLHHEMVKASYDAFHARLVGEVQE